MPVVSRESHHPILAFPEHLTDTTVRLVAGGVSAAILGAYALRAGWVLPVLALGFVLRAIAGPRFSLLARAAILVTDVLLLPTRTIAGAPKQFAAAIGGTVLTTAAVLYGTGLHDAAWAVAGVVAVLAGMEASFSFCLGCRIYTALFGCADCAISTRNVPTAF